MRIKFICCDVFARLAYAAAAASPHTVDLELLPMLAHTEPSRLRADLQARINAVDSGKYDLLVLGYGLCGNATAGLVVPNPNGGIGNCSPMQPGLTAPLPLVMPRVHDCCTLFLGSRARFREVFGNNLSMRWSTCGYFERCFKYGWDDGRDTYRTNPEYVRLLEEYGEENAEYVWETMHPPIETKEAAYIKIDGCEYGDAEAQFAAEIARLGKELILERGDAGWFKRLVNGPWDKEDFLRVEPGQRVKAVYDMEEVVRAE